MLTTDEAGELTETKVTTGSSLKIKVIEKTQMCEINPGVWDGLTPDQARKFYPEEWAIFVKDPYAFRAPRAESYHDLSGNTTSSCIYMCVIFVLKIRFGFSSPGTHLD